MFNKSDLVQQLRSAIHENHILRTPFVQYEQIYVLNERVLAKKHMDGAAAKRGKYFSEVARRRNINVPEVYGMCRPDLLTRKGRTPIESYFTFMQYIHGDCFEDIFDEKLRRRIIRLRNEQIERLLNLSIIPRWANADFHTLYNSPEDKVYLVDLEEWTYGTPAELEEWTAIVSSEGGDSKRK